MELPATDVPIALTAENIRNQAQLRRFNTAELCEILEKHETLNIHTSQPQEKPKSGEIFVVAGNSVRKFRKDGHFYATKKDGKTIQESHSELKDGHVAKLKSWYAYGEHDKNFGRRIYSLINKKHGGVFLFHYLQDKEEVTFRRGRKETTKATPQSSQEAGKVIPTLAVTSGIVKSAGGCSSGIVNHDNYQLALAPKAADTGNHNSFQANVHRSGSSFGIANHENCQLYLPPKTTDSSNQGSIQANAESAVCSSQASPKFHLFPHFQQALMQNIGDDMPRSEYEFENQSFPQEPKSNFFTNAGTANYLPNPATPSSPCESPELMKHMEQSSEKNRKNLKRGNEILRELSANSFGEEYQDHMTFQQNPEWQENGNNCKRNKEHILAMSCSSLSDIQGSAASGGRISFKKVIENDLLPERGLPVRPYKLPELIKNVEQPSDLLILETCFPAVDPADYFGDITNKSLLIRLQNMLSSSCLNSIMTENSLREKFHYWLQEKASEGGNGVTDSDEGGVSVIHLAAALGYDWAIEALTVDAKIDINFSDKNGCTALHWAAYCGRKDMVEFLISKGAAFVLPSFPPGSGEYTPANLAFVAGHPEIGHYLEKKEDLAVAALKYHSDWEIFDEL